MEENNKPYYDPMKDPSVFKGRPGEWKKDIGCDQLEENLFRVIVSAGNETVAHAFGKTEDEAFANAQIIATAPKMLEKIKASAIFLVRVQVEPKKTVRPTAAYYQAELSNLVYEAIEK